MRLKLLLAALLLVTACTSPAHACYLSEVDELVEEFVEAMRESVFAPGELERVGDEVLEEMEKKEW